MNVDAGGIANKFYHTIAFSSANSKSKGVAIVARCNFQIKVLTSWADNMGSIVITRIEFKTRRIALISVYAPNVFDTTFYNTITTKMLKLTDYFFYCRH